MNFTIKSGIGGAGRGTVAARCDRVVGPPGAGVGGVENGGPRFRGAVGRRDRGDGRDDGGKGGSAGGAAGGGGVGGLVGEGFGERRGGGGEGVARWEVGAIWVGAPK